jgi:hypothetical protein
MQVIRSADWQALPSSTKALAIDLMGQYSGRNNGRFSPSFVVMKRCGWTSKATLIAAKRALLDCSFVMLTRKGHPPRTAESIAFTWWELDYEKSMDIDPKRFPYLNFIKMEQADPNNGRGKPPAKSHRVIHKLNDDLGKTDAGGTETEPHDLAA